VNEDNLLQYYADLLPGMKDDDLRDMRTRLDGDYYADYSENFRANCRKLADNELRLRARRSMSKSSLKDLLAFEPKLRNETVSLIAATRAQQEAIYTKYRRNPDGTTSYKQFRKERTRPMFAGGGAYEISSWCGMYLGIEKDGHTHT